MNYYQRMQSRKLRRTVTHHILLFLACAVIPPLPAQTGTPGARSSPAELISAQKQAMAPLAWMDGLWRGTAWTILPTGVKHTITHTERIGPFLDGSIKVIEGRGYDPDGKVTFNAFGTVSYNPAKKTYTLHSYAMGNAGDFQLLLTDDGYVWNVPAGPFTIRYTATLKNGVWTEVGDQIAEGKEPVRFFEMTLKRIGDTKWPGEGAVSMK